MKKALFSFLMFSYVLFAFSQTMLKDITSYIPADKRSGVKAKVDQMFSGRTVTNKDKFKVALQFVQSHDTNAQNVGLCILDNLQKQKCADADFMIGELFMNGHIVEFNIKQCIVWTEKAANDGSSFAWSRLGYFYLNGLGVNKDVQKAIYYFKKGEELGDGEAQYNLGTISCDAGRTDEAIEYFKKSIASGNYNPVLSMYNLGVIYFEREEYNRSYDLFNKLVKIADTSIDLFSVGAVGVDGALPRVYNYYAFFYENGIGGVSRNLTTALKYYNEAAKLGHAKAAIRAEEIKNMLGK